MTHLANIQEDFEKFSLSDFKDIDAVQRRNMRTLLRYRNVFVPTGNKIRVTNALHSLLGELKPWPDIKPDSGGVSDTPGRPD